MSMEGRCRHYSGTSLEMECALGHNIAKLAGGGSLGRFWRIPCATTVPSHIKPTPKRGTCADRNPYTSAELEEFDREAEEQTQAVLRVIASLDAEVYAEKPDTAPCAACGEGTLQLTWSKHAKQGHGLFAGSCDTCGMRWMT